MGQVERYINDTFDVSGFVLNEVPFLPQGKELSDGTCMKMLVYYDIERDLVIVEIGNYREMLRYSSRFNGWQSLKTEHGFQSKNR